MRFFCTFMTSTTHTSQWGRNTQLDNMSVLLTSRRDYTP